MSLVSAIEWTEATWNPWRGCTKVSPGCDHCYMFREQRRYGKDPEVVIRSKTTFDAPLRWKEPRLIFTCSWSDWFHKDADPWRDEAWDVIRRTPHHTYQILTKRPGRMLRHVPWDAYGIPLPNVWLGVSVESQAEAFRARQLATIAAAVRFISAEPLLGPLTLDLAGMHWVIAGGESGPEHRHCYPEWLRSLRDQCEEASVPFFLKQLGGWPDKRGGAKAVLDGRRWTEMPDVYTSPQHGPEGT